MADPIVTRATGAREQHYGQHDPDKCFACKIKTLTFGRVEGGAKGPALQPSGDKRWENDPVKQRIEELQGITIDTDEMNRRRVDLQKENK